MAKRYFFINAAICWMVAVVINALCIAGVNVLDSFKGAWIMHLGIFPVWFYAIWDLKNRPELADYSQRDEAGNRKSPFTFLKLLAGNMPLWLRVLAVTCFYYAGVNFVLCMLKIEGTPVAQGQLYMLQEHGKLIKMITQQEYNAARSLELRLFSGHWIAFYGLAAAVLYPEPLNPLKGT